MAAFLLTRTSSFLDPASQSRLSALAGAPLDRWIALSADESHVVADGETFVEVAFGNLTGTK